MVARLMSYSLEKLNRMLLKPNVLHVDSVNSLRPPVMSLARAVMKDDTLLRLDCPVAYNVYQEGIRIAPEMIPV